MKISFYLHNRRNSKGDQSIMCRVSHRGIIYTRFCVKYQEECLFVNPEHWIKNYNELVSLRKKRKAKKSDRPQRVIEGSPLSDFLNRRIDHEEERILMMLQDIFNANRTPQVEEIRELIFEGKDKSFLSHYDDFAEGKAKRLKEDSKKSYNHLKVIFINYGKEHGEITISSINDSFFLNFEHWLRGKYRPSTFAGVYSRFSRFMDYLFDKKLIKTRSYRDIHIGNTQPKYPAHTWEELVAIQGVSLDPISTIYRDLYIFLCFTGLRFSEWYSINKKHSKKIDLSGQSKIVVKVKTSKQKGAVESWRNIFLLPPAEKVWVQHSGMWDDMKKEFTKLQIYRKISPKLKKVIYPAAGIPQDRIDKMNTHTGRRTLDTLMKQKDVPSKALKEWFGWKDSAMVDYYDKSEEEFVFTKIIEWWEE